MILFDNLQFFIAAGLLAVPAILMGIKEVNLKYYTLFASVLMIILASYNDIITLVWLLCYLILEISLIKIFLKIMSSNERNKKGFYVFLVLSILPLGIFKVAGLLNQNIFNFIGISYMTFKSVQMIIEIYDGLIKEASLVDIVSFFLFFPSVLCGPIDRSRRFTEELNKTPSREEYLEGLGRGALEILMGLLYKKAISSILMFLGINYSIVYGFYLFFDFAGYSLMAIGMGRIYGISLPANFKAPFISVDIKDFWNRWHITLSTWFRDYLFSRIFRNSMRAKRFNANMLTQASFCLIVNMTVMGIWHGLELHYILYGFYHGVLLALTEVYQKKSSFHKTNKQKIWYKNICRVITFCLVMFGFKIFSGKLI